MRETLLEKKLKCISQKLLEIAQIIKFGKNPEKSGFPVFFPDEFFHYFTWKKSVEMTLKDSGKLIVQKNVKIRKPVFPGFSGYHPDFVQN